MGRRGPKTQYPEVMTIQVSEAMRTTVELLAAARGEKLTETARYLLEVGCREVRRGTGIHVIDFNGKEWQ